MPTPTEFPNSKGNSVFFGDYTGLTAVTNAFPIWMDTRDNDLFLCPGSNPPALCTMKDPNGLTANDQEIFTRGLPVPKP